MGFARHPLFDAKANWILHSFLENGSCPYENRYVIVLEYPVSEVQTGRLQVHGLFEEGLMLSLPASLRAHELQALFLFQPARRVTPGSRSAGVHDR